MPDGPAAVNQEAARQLREAQQLAWANHMQRWDSEVRQAERLGWDAQRTAADFGKLGLQSALLVNGGALVAIPPLMQWLTDLQRSQVAGMAEWFLAGLLAAGAGTVTAYVNFTLQSEFQYAYGRKRARELDAEYQGKSLVDDEVHKRESRKHIRFGTATTVSAWIALGLGLLSFAAFALGAFGFIELAQGSPHAAVKVHVSPHVAKPKKGP